MKSVDTQLMLFVDGSLPEFLPTPIAFCAGFTAAMKMALRHPEWAQAFALHSKAPDDESTLNSEALLIDAITFYDEVPS